eukprot:scaffold279045_cov36-Tisochrysis_lutea.AAC.1
MFDRHRIKGARFSDKQRVLLFENLSKCSDSYGYLVPTNADRFIHLRTGDDCTTRRKHPQPWEWRGGRGASGTTSTDTAVGARPTRLASQRGTRGSPTS